MNYRPETLAVHAGRDERDDDGREVGDLGQRERLIEGTAVFAADFELARRCS